MVEDCFTGCAARFASKLGLSEIAGLAIIAAPSAAVGQISLNNANYSLSGRFKHYDR